MSTNQQSDNAVPAAGRTLRLGGLGLVLVAGILVAAWFGMRIWVEREAERDIFERGQPKTALSNLTRWESILLAPERWHWLKAEAARQANDLARLKRLTDESAISGLPIEQVSGPKWLMEASSGATQNAKSNLAKLLLLYGPHRSEVFGALMQGYLIRGGKAEATQLLKLWKEESGDAAEYHFWDGVAAINNYELGRAADALRKAIELKPDYQKAHLELGELLLEQGQPDAAREEFEWLMERTPDQIRVVTGFAKTLLNLGLAEEAAAELDKLQNIEKLPATELSLIADTNLQAGNVDAAAKQIKVLLTRWPDASGILDLARQYEAKVKNIEKSEEYAKKADASQARRPEIDQMLARLNSEPNNQVLRRQIGELMMTYLDPAAGAGYLEVVAMATPTDLKVHQLLLEYFKRENNRERALIHEQFVNELSSRQLPPTASP
jgi:predicted Zn-dependent protease